MTVYIVWGCGYPERTTTSKTGRLYITESWLPVHAHHSPKRPLDMVLFPNIHKIEPPTRWLYLDFVHFLINGLYVNDISKLRWDWPYGEVLFLVIPILLPYSWYSSRGEGLRVPHCVSGASFPLSVSTTFSPYPLSIYVG